MGEFSPHFIHCRLSLSLSSHFHPVCLSPLPSPSPSDFSLPLSTTTSLALEAIRHTWVISNRLTNLVWDNMRLTKIPGVPYYKKLKGNDEFLMYNWWGERKKEWWMTKSRTTPKRERDPKRVKQTKNREKVLKKREKIQRWKWQEWLSMESIHEKKDPSSTDPEAGTSCQTM